jgi:integrase
VKIHNHFTLFLRAIPGGKKVVYYYAYDGDDVRVGPWSTGKRTLTAARSKCEDLFRMGKLIPNKVKPITFGDYAKGFWERGSAYLENQEGRADITPAYIDNCKKMTVNQILPFFADVPLERITHKDVNKWLLGFKKREITVNGKTEIRVYKNTYANTVLGTLCTMMSYAAEQEIIKTNPCARVKRLKNDRKKIEIITVKEVQRLFPDNWAGVWDNNEIAFAANRLASITGMRAGEIMGLRGEYVFDQYIYVCGSYGEYGYGPTKNKETRFIPLIPDMIALLRRLMERNGKGYVFSQDGGAKPVYRKYFYREFHQALTRIGIEQEEIKRRGLTIHSWRHFVNTELQTQGLTLKQVQAVTGHKSDQMTEQYDHFDVRQLAGVMEAQRVIVGKTAGVETEEPELRIVKTEKREERKALKRA